MTDMSIPKIKKKVELAFKDGGVMKHYKMTLFLNKNSKYHSGEETIDEILNDDSHQFIPGVINDDHETFSILNIDSIFYVKELDDIETDAERKELSIQFITGEKMQLSPNEDLPEYRSRAIDFLNGDHEFLTFVDKKNKIYINKNKINKVELV